MYVLCCCCFLSVCFCLFVVFGQLSELTGVCCRIVLGIITKKNILEHLEELKQQTEPLVTSPDPFHVTPLPYFCTSVS